MGDACDRDLVLEIGVVGKQVVIMHPEVTEHRLELLIQPLFRFLVRRLVGDRDRSLFVHCHAIVGTRQVLGREPEIDRVLGHVLQRPVRGKPGLARLLAPEHWRLRFADHLDVPHRELEIRSTGEIEVVEPQRLLEDGGILFHREGQDGLAVVKHVIAPDLV